MGNHRYSRVALAGLFLLALPALAQPLPQPNLCFLSAGLDIGWPARIYCADASGPSRLISSISDDTGIVLADYDRQVLVVGSNSTRTVNGAESYGVHAYSVVDMSAPSSPVRKVNLDYDGNDKFLSMTYLLDVPGRGLLLAVELGDNPTKEGWRPADALTAVSLAAGDPPTVKTLPFSMLTFVRTSGFIGGGPSNFQALWIPQLRGDPLSVLSADGRPHQTKIARPPYIKGEPYELFDLDANNDAIAAITDPRATAIGRNNIDIFDKKAGEWYRATAPFAISRVRAFGPWVAAMADQPRAQRAPGLNTSVSNGAAPDRGSPGREERQAIRLSPRLTLADRFDESTSQEYYSGDLFILNARTRQQFTIHTGQGDSEVVLVTDDAVYYRVNDALFQANFINGKLTAGVRIAEGTEVALCHWAFLSPAPPQE